MWDVPEQAGYISGMHWGLAICAGMMALALGYPDPAPAAGGPPTLHAGVAVTRPVVSSEREDALRAARAYWDSVLVPMAAAMSGLRQPTRLPRADGRLDGQALRTALQATRDKAALAVWAADRHVPEGWQDAQADLGQAARQLVDACDGVARALDPARSGATATARFDPDAMAARLRQAQQAARHHYLQLGGRPEDIDGYGLA